MSGLAAEICMTRTRALPALGATYRTLREAEQRNAPRVAALKLAAGFMQASLGSGAELARWANRHPDKWTEATVLLAQLSGYPVVDGEVPRSVRKKHGHGMGQHLTKRK